MSQTAVILYGPPASGKDTITAALTRLDPLYAPFQRLKAGTGETDGYRLADQDHLAALRSAGDVLFENHRYGNTYVVDRPHLVAMLDDGHIPVLHLGQIQGIRALRRQPIEWIVVELWCQRRTTAERARSRGSADVDARLVAWDETLADVRLATDTDFTGRINTDRTLPGEAAKVIDVWVRAHDTECAR